MVLANQIAGFQIKYISRTKWWNSVFFTCWYQKLRVDRKILGGCGQKWLWPPWLQGEFVHELSWFFASWCKFWKVMNYFNNVWEVVVKNWHGTLISEWIGQIWVCPFQSQDSMICCISIMNELSWFFACSYMLSRKLKFTLGMHIMVKNGIWSWSSWNSKISFISTQK